MRLVTRGDLDGLTCAVLIGLHEPLDEILLIHPQEITDGQVTAGPDDIVANLPYIPGCAMWFDHHQHTATVAAPDADVPGSFGAAPSAARLVYEYYGGEETLGEFDELVRETDRMDSADLTPDDVENPQGYIRLGFTIDSRSGLGPFQEYFEDLVELLMARWSIDEVLELPEVQKRCLLLEEADYHFRQALRIFSTVDGNVVVTDFRSLDQAPRGNRFLIYALFPDINVSARLQFGPEKQYTMMNIGHSIFNRTCKTNVGELAARYGGGGVPGAGSIRLLDDPDPQIQMIIAELKAYG